MRWALAIALLGLPSCAANHRPARGPDGEPGWYHVSCRRSFSNCVDEAGETCPDGYDVATKQDHEGALVQKNELTGGALVTPTYGGEMLIKCRRRGDPPAAHETAEAAPEPPHRPPFNATALEAGEGWFCYSFGATSVSLCARTEEACTAERDSVRKKAKDPDALSDCESQPKAACFSAHNIMDDMNFAFCSRTIASCERGAEIMDGNRSDWANVSKCAVRK